MSKIFRNYLILQFCLGISLGLHAEDEKKPFPEVLTLSGTLDMLDHSHPDLSQYRIAVSEAEIDIALIDADYQLDAAVGLDLRTADKSITPDVEFIDDSRAVLIVDKPLTRFGRDSALRSSIQSRIDAIGQLEQYGFYGLRLHAMRAFFDVLLADYDYAAVNEAMTLAYLEFEDYQELFSFEEVSEIEVLERQSRYLDLRARREEVAGERRASRLRLALALDRPEDTPKQLLEPDLTVYDKQVPDYETLVETVLSNNPKIAAVRLQLQSVTEELEIRGERFRPRLGVRFEAADYADTRSASKDKYRASLYLEIPLTRERDREITIAVLKTRALQYDSELSGLEHELRLQTMTLIKQIEKLKLEKQAAEAELLYREVALDKVRRQYEMEIKARIGTANTEVARALARLARVNFDLAMSWEKLDAITGAEPVTFN